MTTLENRPNTALIVIDVQTAVVADAHERDAVIATIDELVESARAAATPVIWVQHDDDELPSGSPGWELAPELQPADGEPIVCKSARDAFEETDLEERLAEQFVGRLVVTGAQTDFCVRWTLHGALTRGYDTVLVADGHTTDDLSAHGLPSPAEVIVHLNKTWGGQETPGRTTDVVAAADVSFSA